MGNANEPKGQKIVSKMFKVLNPDMPDSVTVATKAVTEIVTALLKDPRQASISLSQVAQRVVAGQKLRSVLAELESIENAGKIPKEYLKSLQGQYTLLEFLDFLENGKVIDENVFQVLKKVFLVAASQKEDVIVQQYMKIAKELSAGEVIVLNASYKIASEGKITFGNGSVPQEQWGSIVARESGLKHTELALMHGDKLAEKKMMNTKVEGTSQGTIVSVNPHARLSNLGFGFCEYIAQYENLTKDVNLTK